MNTPRLPRRATRTVFAVLVSSALTGCSGGPLAGKERPKPKRTIKEMQGAASTAGSRDAVELLRDSMRARNAYGHTDPYKPVRTPAQVMPIWVVPHRDERTEGRRRVSGHWEHSVVEPGDWVTD